MGFPASIRELFQNWQGLALSIGILGGAWILGLAVHYLVFNAAGRVARRTKRALDESLVRHLRAPSRLIIPLLVMSFSVSLVEVSPTKISLLNQTISIALMLSMAWFFIKLTDVMEDLVFAQYRVDVRDNLRARKIHTQIQILRRVIVFIVCLLTVAMVLMNFEKVRQLGTSILASAGIAGVIVGFAAQRSIATLLAGIQIAITQPFRIDDAVVVENEWGHVEEITLTYVVLRLWDLRRMVLPMTYFLEKPFQNWTRTSSELLGTVFLYVDYTVPVQPVREELHRIVEKSETWDHRVCALHVTNATEHTVELRALVSASDSSNLSDLRCEVREKLVNFLQRNYPAGLPRVRAEVQLLDEGKAMPSASRNDTSSEKDPHG